MKPQTWYPWSPEETENLRVLIGDQRKSWSEIVSQLNALHPERPARTFTAVRERGVLIGAPPRTRKNGTFRGSALAPKAKVSVVAASGVDPTASVNAAWVALAAIREEGRAEGRAEVIAAVQAAMRNALARFLPAAAETEAAETEAAETEAAETEAAKSTSQE